VASRRDGVLSPAGVRLALTAAPATGGRWGLGYGLGLTPGGERLAYHEGANRGWRAGLALLPDRRVGIVLLANGDDGNAPIDAVVQQWLAFDALNRTRARLRTAGLAILAVAASVALWLAVRRRSRPGEGARPPQAHAAWVSAVLAWRSARSPS
jgi:Beta-lactamase